MKVDNINSLSNKVASAILHEIYDTFIAYIYSREAREACLRLIIGKDNITDHIEIHWKEIIDSNELIESIFNQNSTYSFTSDAKSFFFGRSMELQKQNNFLNGFVIDSFVNVIEQIIIGVWMNETLLLVGETGTGKTTIVQNIANVIGKKLHVFNMSQNTDSTDLMGGFKPIDIKLLLKPLYVDFLSLFNMLFDQNKNKGFTKELVRNYNENNSQKFFDCVDKGLKEINSKLSKLKSNNKKNIDIKAANEAAVKLNNDFKDTKSRVNKADKTFIFKFIEGKLVQSIKNGDWILLDEVNLAPEDTLNKVISIIDKTVLLTEKADVENIQIHPEFRMFCCMNPHHSSAGKKSLNPILRSKMTEIFVDELFQTKDILPIVQINIHHALKSNKELVTKITEFYLNVKKKQQSLEIHYGTKKPSLGLRNLVRTMKYVYSALNNTKVTFNPNRALYEALMLNFTTQVDEESKILITEMINRIVFNNKKLSNDPASSFNFANKSVVKDDFIVIENYVIEKGKFDPLANGAEANWQDKFIMTPTFIKLVKTLASIICCTNYAILIEGPTSAGKTSTIEYLAKKTHNKWIRINNHEHTDIEEYIGSYIPDAKGKLVFQEGLLVEAVRNGYWVILDELNLAPSEVLEALNRLLDDNNELFIVETDEVIKAHPKFRLFATQNPTEGYGGRKELSEAFKNRFIILHAEEIPNNELKNIVIKRWNIPESFAKILVNVMESLKIYRQNSSVFRGNDSVITVRDLLKWASRYHATSQVITKEDMAHEGFILLAERMRNSEDRQFVKDILEKQFKCVIDIEGYYNKYFDEHLHGIFDIDPEVLLRESGFSSIIITKTLKKLAVIVHKCIVNKEPALLVGETGWGKTTICQLLAIYMSLKLFTINVHQNTETSDFIGWMRTKRDKISNMETLNNLILEILEQLNTENEDIKLLESKIRCEETSLKIQIKEYSKWLKALKQLSKNLENQMINDKLNQANKMLINIKSIFEWQDGVLINSMKDGGILLIDEISLANDSVLERLNSVFETERTLILAEKASSSVIKIVAKDTFGVVSTMNPSGDFGKKELSPALRNRMTEIWVESYFDQKELLEYANQENKFSELKRNISMNSWDLYAIIKEKLIDEDISQKLFKVIVYYNFILSLEFNLTRKKLSIRDVLNFIEFYRKSTEITEVIRFWEAVNLVIIDGIGIEISHDKNLIKNKLEKYIKSLYENQDALRDNDLTVTYNSERFGIDPYYLENFSSNVSWQNFSFEATKHNIVKILRGLRLGKPILLEGPPGVGKTSTVESIARAIGKKIIRINLSEHTDMMDLLGSEYPIPVVSDNDNKNEDITFQWWDGALLTAIKNGYWFLLDEMNLAHQSVLEGLNAILDHRKTVYIPELDKEFKCHPEFFMFASQNPTEHGIGRKNLPKSFLNRFSKIYLDDLTDYNYFDIIKWKYGDFCNDKEIQDIIQMTHEFETIILEDKQNNSTEMSFDSHEKFNLRDLSRFFSVYSSPLYAHLSKEQRLLMAFEINCAKLISSESRKLALQMFCKWMNVNGEFNKSFLIKNTAKQIEFYLPKIDQSNIPILSFSKIIGKSKEEESRKHILTTPFNLTAGIYSYYLYLLSICVFAKKASKAWDNDVEMEAVDDNSSEEAFDYVGQKWPVLLIGKKSIGKTSLVHTLAKLTNNRWVDIVLWESTDTTDILGSYQQVNIHGKAQFVWKDSVLIEAIQNGDWVVIENFNHRGGSTAVVLDRLNSLLEEGNDELVINEAGLIDGELKKIKAHPNFRIFFVLNEETMVYSTISKPLRNRCWEIYIPFNRVENESELDYAEIESTVITICNNMGIHGTKIPLSLFKVHWNAITKDDGVIKDYELPLFFKWVQNICNSQKFNLLTH